MFIEEKTSEKSAEQSFNSSQVSVNPDVDSGMTSPIQDVEKGEKYVEVESENLAADDGLVRYYLIVNPDQQ